jgi:superfamily II DNA or RNA helicase
LQSARERLLCGVEVIDEGFKRPELAFVACASGVELERLQ